MNEVQYWYVLEIKMFKWMNRKISFEWIFVILGERKEKRRDQTIEEHEETGNSWKNQYLERDIW